MSDFTPIQNVLVMGSSLRFMRRDENEEDDHYKALEAEIQRAEIQREMTRIRFGTGRVLPTKFTPPRPSVDRPQTLFAPGLVSSTTPSRFEFVRRVKGRTQILIYTDGACLGNGGVLPRAGCAIIYRPCYPERKGDKSFPLETEGPTGEPHPQTSNRAELRAVLAALRSRCVYARGYEIVIATDSEYVVKGITSWVRGWLRNGWKTRAGVRVANQDLWLCILGEVERADRDNVRVSFWRIPREWNEVADRFAKEAALQGGCGGFKDV